MSKNKKENIRILIGSRVALGNCGWWEWISKCINCNRLQTNKVAGTKLQWNHLRFYDAQSRKTITGHKEAEFSTPKTSSKSTRIETCFRAIKVIAQLDIAHFYLFIVISKNITLRSSYWAHEELCWMIIFPSPFLHHHCCLDQWSRARMLSQLSIQIDSYLVLIAHYMPQLICFVDNFEPNNVLQ